MDPINPSRPTSPSNRRESSRGLRDAIAAVYSGGGQGAAAVEAFRRSVVFVPQDASAGVLTADQGGVRWLLAFSTEQELVRYAVAVGRGDREWDYLTVFGWRLLDVAVPAVGRPAGVALDVAGARPMVFPPVAGIVPDDAVVRAPVGDVA